MAGRRLPLTWIIGATAVALVAAGAVVLILDDDADDPAGDQTRGQLELTPAGDIPESAQDVVLSSLEGAPDQQLGALLDGRPMVLNFFASWCQPCLDEMPGFESVHQDLGDQVSFVGLAENDTDEDALATVERTGVNYPTFSDRDGSALIYFEGIQMPVTVFIGADGKVLESRSGKLSETELRAKLSEHFGIGRD